MHVDPLHILCIPPLHTHTQDTARTRLSLAEVCSDAGETGRLLQNYSRTQSCTPVRRNGGMGWEGEEGEEGEKEREVEGSNTSSENL